MFFPLSWQDILSKLDMHNAFCLLLWHSARADWGQVEAGAIVHSSGRSRPVNVAFVLQYGRKDANVMLEVPGTSARML